MNLLEALAQEVRAQTEKHVRESDASDLLVLIHRLAANL